MVDPGTKQVFLYQWVFPIVCSVYRFQKARIPYKIELVLYIFLTLAMCWAYFMVHVQYFNFFHNFTPIEISI